MSKTENRKIRGDLLCETFSVVSKCKYIFHPGNIPFEYGGTMGADEIMGTVMCDSSEDADRCATAIADLMDNGYGEERNWYVALDIADVTSNIFNGELMRYLHMDINKGMGPASAEKIREVLIGCKMVFVYLHLHQMAEVTKAQGTLEQILPEGITDSWFQVSLCPWDVCEFAEIWYK